MLRYPVKILCLNASFWLDSKERMALWNLLRFPQHQLLLVVQQLDGEVIGVAGLQGGCHEGLGCIEVKCTGFQEEFPLGKKFCRNSYSHMMLLGLVLTIEQSLRHFLAVTSPARLFSLLIVLLVLCREDDHHSRNKIHWQITTPWFC